MRALPKYTAVVMVPVDLGDCETEDSADERASAMVARIEEATGMTWTYMILPAQDAAEAPPRS